ncbi:MAG TPA: hypothetical protein VJW76_05860 [Verrucomicrobiae bacterium]|nr:hypothetical protein [Verrucomicrobiae bacterium]
MTVDQASRISLEYQEIVENEEKRGGRRSPHQLPAPKEVVITALKLEIAQLFFIHAESNDDLWKPLINAAMFIDSFDDMPMEAGAYIEAMQQRRREMDNFVLELLKIERNHPFYWQRIYSLLGIVSETKTTSFFEGLKQRLRLGQWSGSADADPSTNRRPVGRLNLG